MHTEMKTLIFGDMKLNCLGIPVVKHRGGRIMLCFGGGGTDALHKIDDIPMKEHYV